MNKIFEIFFKDRDIYALIYTLQYIGKAKRNHL